MEQMICHLVKKGTENFKETIEMENRMICHFAIKKLQTNKDSHGIEILKTLVGTHWGYR